MAAEAGDEFCRAAAFHEAGHIVIACCRKLAISPRGICINNFAEGRAWFRGATNGEDVAVSDLDDVIVALFAGCAAHRKMSANIGYSCQGDDDRIAELLKTHVSDPLARDIRREALREALDVIAKENWPTISQVAEGLWRQPWRPKHPNRQWPQEKHLSAEEVTLHVAPLGPVVDERVL